MERLKTMATIDTPHEQGVIRGLELAIAHLDEVRALNEEED